MRPQSFPFVQQTLHEIPGLCQRLSKLRGSGTKSNSPLLPGCSQHLPYGHIPTGLSSTSFLKNVKAGAVPNVHRKYGIWSQWDSVITTGRTQPTGQSHSTYHSPGHPASVCHSCSCFDACSDWTLTILHRSSVSQGPGSWEAGILCEGNDLSKATISQSPRLPIDWLGGLGTALNLPARPLHHLQTGHKSHYFQP
jgi:hypothetical protein